MFLTSENSDTGYRERACQTKSGSHKIPCASSMTQHRHQSLENLVMASQGAGATN